MSQRLLDMFMPSGDARLDGIKQGLHSVEVSSGNQAITECVEKGLFDILGESAYSAALYFIESKGGLKPSLIPSNPEGFTDALRGIFGPGSAELLRSVLRELRLKETKLGRDRLLHDFAEVIELALTSVETGII